MHTLDRKTSLMGRRQFLIAGGLASTCALTGKKHAGLQTNIAMASEKSEATNHAGNYSDKYKCLLSPIRLGNVILKNRMTQADSFPRYLMGPETFPSEQIINHYANVAKNGCAIVMCFGGESITDRSKLAGEMAHTAMWAHDDITVQHYFAQMTDAIHFYGSKAALGLHLTCGQGYNISKVSMRPGLNGKEGKLTSDGKEIPEEEIQKIYEEAATKAKYFKSVGFDMVNFHMSYQGSIMAHSLSTIMNKRTDKYGGGLENRARLPLEMFQAVKKACGQDFLVGANISGEDRSGGYSPEDAAEYAKIWEETLDLLVIRGKDQNASHPNGYNLTKGDSQILRYCEVIKKGGTKIAVAPNGGFQDLDANEAAIAGGKADIITMARAWIADPEYGKKAYEGRGEDVVPCIMCGECHGTNEGPWYSYCSVNPKFGIAHKVNRMIDPPTVPRRVGVIGGGPAGMKAALTAAERGHTVTLYEKNDFLGGQLKHTDYASFKWPLRDFKNYLIRQVEKSGVEVLLKTTATPDMIRAKGYDAVIVALGAEPIIPENIPGAGGRNVRAPIFVFGNEAALGKNVVVIGGDQIGTETGMYLAENGHKTTVLTEEKELATDASVYVNRDLIRAYEALEAQGNFSYVTGATVTGISDDAVTYVDPKGKEKTIQADSVAIYAGRRPRQVEAMTFSGVAPRLFAIGDCSAAGDVRTHFQANVWISIRSAFGAASEI